MNTLISRILHSEKSSGILLMICTLLSLYIANSSMASQYLGFWKVVFLGLSIEHWINDALMAIFFLLIGLELEREIYSGDLSQPKKALLPIIAALGGVILPALIHFGFNQGSITQNGIGIPMATDIAFALGVLALLGSRIPTSLKVFLTALAVIDDLIAIIVIALFYTQNLNLYYLLGSLSIFGLLIGLNRIGHVMALSPYIIGGVLMWFLMLKSGVHATISGVLLAFAIPFTHKANDLHSPSYRLEKILHTPVIFFILPLFALANTGIVISSSWAQELLSTNSLGIMGGLIIGKPLGITLFCFIAIVLGICQLPKDIRWAHIMGAGMLGGIGFTMSIFITNLAFPGEDGIITASKIAILLASMISGLLGFIWLRMISSPQHTHK